MKMQPLTPEEIKTALIQQIQLYTVRGYIGPTSASLKSAHWKVEKLNKVNGYAKAKEQRLARIHNWHGRPVFDNYWAAYAYKLKAQQTEGTENEQRMA